MKREPLIIHHCDSDGMCGALAIYLMLDCSGEPIPVQYGDDPPDDDIFKGRDVYIVDFSYPRDTLMHIHWKCDTLLVFDHHKTAQADCEGLSFCHFDMERCGARIAFDYMWDHADPTVVDPMAIKNLLEIVKYVQDRDLWKWEMEYSREVNAFLASWPLTLKTWKNILFTWDRIKAVNYGFAILRRDQRLVETIMRNAYTATFVVPDGQIFKVKAVNTPVLQSEVVGGLAEFDGVDFGVAWWGLPNKEFVFSLRSRGDVDVASVAKQFGGGGHAKAAGFKLCHHYPDFILKEL